MNWVLFVVLASSTASDKVINDARPDGHGAAL